MKKILAFVIALTLLMCPLQVFAEEHIKWVDFGVSSACMQDALEACVNAHSEGKSCDFSVLIACLGAKYGGDFSAYKKSDLENFAARLSEGGEPSELVSNTKLLNYYIEAYGAVLGGFVGEYTEYTSDGNSVDGYGLRAFSPIASGYSYSHFDDFGASRSFGYKRSHLGHDLMGSVGTPVIAVEGGYVEACGWNMYGGWRVGIRSFDGKRYYYYAHLRKGHPYCDIYEGKQVAAGEVIGYLGMTGYSSRSDVNNINVPHLHYGLEVIFDPSQKDGWNQIWIDMYEITKFLYQNRAGITDGENGEKKSLRVRFAKDSPD